MLYSLAVLQLVTAVYMLQGLLLITANTIYRYCRSIDQYTAVVRDLVLDMYAPFRRIQPRRTGMQPRRHFGAFSRAGLACSLQPRGLFRSVVSLK